MSDAPFSGIIRYKQTGHDRGMEPATSGEWCAVSDAFARIEDLDKRIGFQRELVRMAVADREAARADRYRLQALVEDAFREGVRAGLSDNPGSRTWENSDAYAALNGGDDG